MGLPPRHLVSRKTCAYVGDLPEFLHKSLLSAAQHLIQLKEAGRHNNMRLEDAFGQVLCSAKSYVSQEYGNEHTAWFLSANIRRAILHEEYREKNGREVATATRISRGGDLPTEILVAVAREANRIARDPHCFLPDIEKCLVSLGVLDRLHCDVVEINRQQEMIRKGSALDNMPAEHRVYSMMNSLEDIDCLLRRTVEINF